MRSGASTTPAGLVASGAILARALRAPRDLGGLAARG